MSDAGGGHRAVSRALSQALIERHGAEVRVEDLLALDRRSLPHRMVRIYPWVIRYAPLLNGIAYHGTNQNHLYRVLSHRSVRRLSPHVVDLMAEWRPNVVVTTHPLCNRLVLDVLEAFERPIPVVAVVTELVSVHVSWVDERLDAYSTATREAYDAVLARGAPEGRVVLTGLPVDARFSARDAEPGDLREALGLERDRFSVMLVGGGEGAGRLAAQVRALDRSGIDLQTIVVCGRNVRLRERLLRASLRQPAAILGFVDVMPRLMRAADVVVTKGGPTTIAEALVAGQPVVVTSVLPGQEEGNDHFVKQHGVGLAARSPRAVATSIRRLAHDRELLGQMAARTTTLMPANGADRAAELVVQTALARGVWPAGGSPAPGRAEGP
jgi:1,2-diacylglycerol 3-beta-galactosyltransferase